jgi:hypothetical protein
MLMICHFSTIMVTSNADQVRTILLHLGFFM